MSICSIEDVAANTSKPFWFQLYVMRDREFIHGLVEEAGVALFIDGRVLAETMRRRAKAVKTVGWAGHVLRKTIVPLLIVLAVAVGFLPALSAYRTDVAEALQSSP